MKIKILWSLKIQILKFHEFNQILKFEMVKIV